MVTPRTDPNILEKWEEEKQKLRAKGYSINRICSTLAEQYDVGSRQTVYYWLIPQYREHKKIYYKNHKLQRQRYKKRYNKIYLKKPIVMLKKREYEKNYRRLTRHLDFFLREILRGDEKISLNEISDRIKMKAGIQIGNQTIENILVKYDKKFGEAPLSKNEKMCYSLNLTFYQKNDGKGTSSARILPA